MGLEGVYLSHTMESFGEMNPLFSESFNDCSPFSGLEMQRDGDYGQLDLMQQVCYSICNIYWS